MQKQGAQGAPAQLAVCSQQLVVRRTERGTERALCRGCWSGFHTNVARRATILRASGRSPVGARPEGREQIKQAEGRRPSPHSPAHFCREMRVFDPPDISVIAYSSGLAPTGLRPKADKYRALRALPLLSTADAVFVPGYQDSAPLEPNAPNGATLVCS